MFSSKGSHGTYHKADRHDVPRHLIIVDDLTSDGPGHGRRDTWRDLLDVKRQAWYGFGGAWGEIGVSIHTTGPLGPSR